MMVHRAGKFKTALATSGLKVVADSSGIYAEVYPPVCKAAFDKVERGGGCTPAELQGVFVFTGAVICPVRVVGGTTQCAVTSTGSSGPVMLQPMGLVRAYASGTRYCTTYRNGNETAPTVTVAGTAYTVPMIELYGRAGLLGVFPSMCTHTVEVRDEH